MSAIRTKQLRRVFGSTTAVDGLDLEVREGEIFGLVGPDGAGKTTTMRMLAGILDPTEGEAEVAGCDVRRKPESVKEHIGYMSQRFGLYPDLTVSENIQFYADIYSVPKREYTKQTERLLHFSNLTPFKKRLAGNLSGGMKQKLGLACALIHTPRLLLLDEPTNGVDPVSRRDFWRILYQLLRDGVTIFVSTAYLDEAERCNRLAMLHRGHVLGTGTPDEIKGMLSGSTWEMQTDQSRQVASLLREQLPQARVTMYGDRVHATGENLESDYLHSLLSESGFEISGIRSIESSLEDVFIGVLAKYERKGEIKDGP
ncbi:MAG: ABC transporter ATP-binding protein [Verrucomicrobiae bacterium]|nr:ABC transporter ATP-binding protein [Verrucomicrobiae bacterium]